MTDDPIAPVRPSLGMLLARLAEQVRALIRAEISLYRAEAAWRAVSLGWAAGFAFGALALLQALTVALLVGLILALAPLWGIGWAVAAVTLGGLALAALLAWLAYRKIASALEPDAPEEAAEQGVTS